VLRTISLSLSALRLAKTSAFLLTLLAPAARIAAQDLAVNYTGRLFGYYRIEPMEPLPDKSTHLPEAKLTAVQRFLKDHPGSETLLLGMGDNFAPEFGAAIQQEFLHSPQDPQQPKEPTPPEWAPCIAPAPSPTDTVHLNQRKLFAPESLYKSETRLPAMADCDNVTRFLMTAGYRAIVPGREDFIYSGTWLRRVAYLLKGASDPANPAYASNPFNPKTPKWNSEKSSINNLDGKLHMLAANLRVQVSDPNDNKAKACPLLFADDLYKNHACAAGEDFVTQEMDWLRRIDASLAGEPNRGRPGNFSDLEESLDRKAKEGFEFRTQLLLNQAAIVNTLLSGYGCAEILASFNEFIKSDAGAASNDANAKEKEVRLEAAARGALKKPLTCPVFAKLYEGEPDPQKIKTGSERLATVLNSVIDALRDSLDPSHSPLLPRKARQDAARLLLLLIELEQKNAGYTIARYANDRYALVIGVVGTETMQEVTKTYFQVYPGVTDHKRPLPSEKTAIKGNAKESKPTAFPLEVADPVFAVTTVLRAASAARDADLPDSRFDTVIVMAQMPHSETYELGARVRGDIESLYKDQNEKPSPDRPLIDLILSEAQSGHQSPGHMTIAVNLGYDTPVLTPADNSTPDPDRKTDPVSTVTVSYPDPDKALPPNLIVKNKLPERTPVIGKDGNLIKMDSKQLDAYSAASLLHVELHSLGQFAPNSDYEELWGQCPEHSACRNSVLMQYLLRALQRSSNSGVVLLKRRDFFFDWLGKEYADYTVCEDWVEDHYPLKPPAPQKAENQKEHDFYSSYCQLHTALDRVLWKGDYSERIMIDGTTLTGLMKTAQQQTDQEQTLLARDLHQEWLMTYGIVTAPPQNLVATAAGPESFSVPGVNGCNSSPGPLFGKDPAGGSPDPTYCIDGQSVAPDRAYWLTTSNQLADDTTVYTTLGAWSKKNKPYSEDPHYQKKSDRLFITTEIANEILPNLQRMPSAPLPDAASQQQQDTVPAKPATHLALLENQHQARSLVQIDFTKLVVGYSLTNPSLSAADLATYLDGASNSQAITPKSQELDLEAATRLTYAPSFKRFTFGTQSDAEFDRKFTQNLTGSPDTLTYSINTFSVGGFAQLSLPAVWKDLRTRQGLDLSTRNLPRWFLVLAPYQYQRQIAATYLALPFYTEPSGSTKYSFSTTQYNNLRLPIPDGFSQRIGVRFEAAGTPHWTPDPGSYAEIGPEYLVQNNVLSALDLKDIPPVGQTTGYTVCPAKAQGVAYQNTGAPGNPFVNCVKNAYYYASPQKPLNAASNIIPVPQTLHAGGLYWNAHIQKNLDAQKSYSISFDTAGDSYLMPGYVLSTQTRYALTTKLALNLKIFPSLANLTLSPTWSGFFYENQGDEGATPNRTSLITNGFSISAKWYFARDAEVPFHKQGWFSGPTSVDQTSSAKMK
jgi:hypothetical protein